MLPLGLKKIKNEFQHSGNSLKEKLLLKIDKRTFKILSVIQFCVTFFKYIQSSENEKGLRNISWLARRGKKNTRRIRENMTANKWIGLD